MCTRAIYFSAVIGSPSGSVIDALPRSRPHRLHQRLDPVADSVGSRWRQARLSGRSRQRGGEGTIQPDAMPGRNRPSPGRPGR